MMGEMITIALRETPADIAVMAGFMAILFAGALMDLFLQQVYDMIWVLGIVFTGIFIFIKGELSGSILLGLIIYFIAQEFLER